MPDLRNRVIAITGASSGIGAATAVACARAGMDVALGARRIEALEQVAQQIRALGRRAVVVACDVDRDEDVQRFIDAAVNDLGRLDAVFANAGYGLLASVMKTTDAQTRAIFETNFHGTLRVIRAAVPVFRVSGGGGGHVLICTSAVSEIGLPMYGAYAATKAAQDSIAGALRAELRDERIHVTSVHPIGTRTEFFDRVDSRSGSGPASHNTPSWARQTPEHVARCIVRGLRRPRPEVWPSTGARFGLALTTAFPRLAAWAMRRMYAGMKRD